MAETEFKVPEKKKNEAQKAYDLFAKDGCIHTKILGNLFKSLGLHMDNERLQDWADEEDEEACGKLEFSAFNRIFEKKLKEDEDERELKDAFRVLDKDKKGVIACDDLRWILRRLGDDLTDDDIEEMITETDTDNSGTVDYDEFYALMMG